MNAPFPLSSEAIALADLADPGEVARLEAFVRDMEGSVFHRPAWLKAVEAGTGQRALGLVAEKAGMVTGWLPLTLAHSPVFGRALVSSGFGVGGGPLATSKQTRFALCEAASELAVRQSCAEVEVRSGDTPASWHRWSDKHCNFARDLSDYDEAELLAIPRKQRAEVRKSLKNDLEIVVGNGEDDRAAHYAVYAASVHNLGTPVFPRSLFDAMLDAFGDNADILTVRHGGDAVASVLSLYHAGTVMPFWGGGIFAARGLRANERMYYELMLHARRKGCTRFDFGRSKTGSGPHSYKKNWGFEPQPLTYSRWAAPGAPARNTDPTSDTNSRLSELWKRLPPAVANRLGPPIAKGLA
ncbi:FemAB family XrtA/PEP-CTERM system-associated protein [Erythrobacter sp. HKB08]|uniref:FemAB family XrtA/PEP-CTERM system-associated protein n=1 Tax=Erythrobacter sp. HKB08 TaxID=2502843 RepID=UPI0010087FCB|nr:FemAB family XrtA/PEP-CTERM system-associated protein [Erythrobacter sp. HKB08]